MEKRALAKKLGGLVRRLRLRRGLSQEAFAQACRPERAHVGKIERGEVNVTVATTLSLVKGLDLTLAGFFSELETELDDAEEEGASSAFVAEEPTFCCLRARRGGRGSNIPSTPILLRRPGRSHRTGGVDPAYPSPRLCATVCALLAHRRFEALGLVYAGDPGTPLCYATAPALPPHPVQRLG